MTSDTGYANAAYQHLIYECLDMIPTFRGGKTVKIEPLAEAEPIRFPGFDDAYACHVGHPEPATLPRTIKANSVSNVMFYGKYLTDTLRDYVKKVSTKELPINEATFRYVKEVRKAVKSPEIAKEFTGFPPGLCVTVTGKKSKKKKVAIGIKRQPYGGMAGITSIPLAIAAFMIMEGKISDKGVLTPEGSIDPREFFDRYALYCGEKLSGNDVLIRREVDL